MISPRSLSGTGFLSVLVTIFVIGPAIGSFWVYTEISQNEKKLAAIKSQYIHFYKTILFNDVHNVMNFIEYKRSNSQERVREIVKERVQHAYSLASHVYSMNKSNPDPDIVKTKIIETLRPVRWNNGRGYFFILNREGTTLLNADIPSMENTDTRDMKDIDGRYVIRDLVMLARENDSGFYTYRWTKPGTSGADHEKITYVKHFKPLDWILCAGFYVEDMEESIQAEILDRISQVTTEKDQYIFVLKKDGFCLYHPLANYHRKNIINHTSTGGRPVIRELLEISKRKNGGFIEYPWEKPSTRTVENKLTFAVTVKDWGWTIGKGIYLNEVQQTIETEKAAFQRELKRNLLIIIGFSGAVVLFALGLGILVTNRLYKGILAFTNFFKKAADADIKINLDELNFREFKLLGTLANQMVEDRIQKEKALKQSMRETIYLQNLLGNITDAMPSTLIAINADMTIIHWNQKAAASTGIKANQAEGKNITDVFELTEDEIELIKSTLETGRANVRARVQKTGPAAKRYEDLTVYPLMTQNIKGVVIRIDDTTERVRIEEMMIQSEKMLSVGGLAAGMAHEINNPLSGILGNIDVLKNRLLNDLPVNIKGAEKVGVSFEIIRSYVEERGLPQILDNIRQAGSRAAKIVSDMLSFSRMSTSNFAECDIAELLDKTVDLASTSYDLKKKFDFKRIRVTRHYPPDMPGIICESSKLQQVFLNILSNGAHAMADNPDDRPPEFVLTLEYDETHATIKLSDNGPGIPEDIRKRIFEPFFTTKEVGIGTGLGLSVSYFIITDHHKGTLTVESRMNEGTCFTIRIPLVH